MLLKFDCQEVGRFSSLKHKAQQFTRLTLIYARNGYGKSTICNILRSATADDPNFIKSRRRLGASRESTVTSKWAVGGDANYATEKWNRCPGKIYVFDQDFVLQNLHVGESVTKDNKKSLLPVILGEKGVSLANAIVKIEADIKKADDDIKLATTSITGTHRVIETAKLLDFCQKEVPERIDESIERANKKIQAVRQINTVHQKSPLILISLPDEQTLLEIAARSLDGVSDDAATRVKQHIIQHHLEPNGEKWLRYGLDRTGENCAFCNQSVKDNDLITDFKGYFSEAFNKLNSDKEAAIAEIGNLA